MTALDWADAPTITQAPVRVKRERARGLRFPSIKIPSLPLVSQVVGALATLSGVYIEWGAGITLIVGGVASVALGALREAGKV